MKLYILTVFILAAMQSIAFGQEHSHPKAEGLNFEYFASFGLGVAVMSIWIFYLVGQNKELRKDAKQLTDTLLSSGNETVKALTNATNVIEAIGETTRGEGQNTRNVVEAEAKHIRSHTSTVVKLAALGQSPTDEDHD
jgi:hypothetical protein